MSSYERALTLAREAPLVVPEFDAIADASARERETWGAEERDARAGGRRWLLFAAALWPFFVMASAIELSWSIEDALRGTRDGLVVLLLPALLLMWAARLSQQQRFRSAILTRGIAASNLVMALLYICEIRGAAFSWALFGALLAIAAGRSLQLLGRHGLDASEDLSSSFEPIAFRGLLTLALVMACADAMILVFLTSLGVMSFVGTALTGAWSEWVPLAARPLGLTAGAGVLMAINVWGLSHLRTWALITNLVTNIAVAALAMNDMLWSSTWYSGALTTTAAIQLLLPLPIFAAVFGYQLPERVWRFMRVALRVAIPVLVLATVAIAAYDIGTNFVWPSN